MQNRLILFEELDEQVEDEFQQDSDKPSTKTKFIHQNFNLPMKNSLNFNQIQKRNKCDCENNLNQFQSCKTSMKIIQLYYKRYEYTSLEKDYNLLIKNDTLLENNLKQIKRDINRTHPQIKFFQSSEIGQIQLERVLQCISKYDPNIGYVQGMNFMIAGLLYHSQEYVSFWNFVQAYEKLQIRDIYLPELPGLSKHQQLIEILMCKLDKKFYNHLIDNNINFSFICTPIFLSLFGMVIPIQLYAQFFYQLLKQGWIYAYKVLLSYLMIKREEYMLLEGAELIVKITSANSQFQTDNNSDIFFKEWEKSMYNLDRIVIDKQFIENKLDDFDYIRKQFRNK